MLDGNGKNGKTIKINVGVLSIIVLLIAQLIGLAFTYGTLTQQVSFNRELIKDYKATQQIIMDKLDNTSARLTTIEVMLKDR